MAAQAKKKTEEVKEEAKEKLPHQQVLDQAYDKKYLEMIVLGVMPDGKLDMIGTHPTFQQVSFLLSKAHFELMLLSNNQGGNSGEE